MPTPFIIVFTSYWCRWYDQYKNSPPLFPWRLRLMVRTPPFHGGNVAFKSHRRHHHPLFFLLSYQRRPVWLTNPTGLIWCFLLTVRKPSSQDGNARFNSRKHHHIHQVGSVYTVNYLSFHKKFTKSLHMIHNLFKINLQKIYKS